MTRATAHTQAKPAANIPHNGRKHQEKLFEHTSDKISTLYTEGKKAATEAQMSIKEYSKELSATVQKHPLSSLLIAGGVGILLSKIFRK